MKNKENCAKCQHHVLIIDANNASKINGCNLGGKTNAEEQRFNFLLVNKFGDGNCLHFQHTESPVPIFEESL